MPFLDLVFGEYSPDKGGLVTDEGYLTVADNVRPTPNGWKPIPDPATVTGATTLTTASTAVNGFAAVSETYTGIFMSDNVQTYQSNDNGATWNTVLSQSTATNYSFAQFDELVISVNENTSNTPQRKSLDDSQATAFTSLGGSPPKGKKVATIRRHVFLGDLDTNRFAVQWCAIDDPEDWPTPGTTDALSKQSGQEKLPRELGVVTEIVGGERFGLVFQERGITRFTYIGGDIVYQVDTFEWQHGIPVGSAFGGGSWVRVNNQIYFSNTSGIFVTDGVQVRNLTEGRAVEALFRQYVTQTAEFRGEYAVTASYDALRGLIYFYFPTFFPVSGGVLCYSPTMDMFCTHSGAELGISFTLPDSQRASTVAVVESDTTILLKRVGEQDSNYTSQAPTIQLDTGYIEPAPGRYSEITGIHVLASNLDSPTISYRAVSDPESIRVGGTYTTIGTSDRGIIDPIRDNQRYYSFRLSGTQGVDCLLRGLRIFYEPTGEI